MRKIYIGPDSKCHTSQNEDGTFSPVETDFFDGKCDAFIEGHCCEIKENRQAIYPWKLDTELNAIQTQYEQALIADMQNALNTLGVTLDE